MSHSQISLKTSWGDTIYGNAWTIETPIANIVIAHGMGEIGRASCRERV